MYLRISTAIYKPLKEAKAVTATDVSGSLKQTTRWHLFT